MNRVLRRALLCATCLPASWSAAAAAQATDSVETPADEIVVTAQRRAQSVQDVPLAVSAFGGDFVEDARITDYTDLAAYTPGFNGEAISSFQPNVTIRGIGPNDFAIGGDPSIGIYVDDVYVGRAGGAVGNLVDVERVEVLKGPQGTLFGRNTTAGAISIIRNKPSDEASLSGRAAVGNFDLVELEATANTPLADALALRVTGFYRDRDGTVPNLAGGAAFDGISTAFGRAALRYEAGPVDAVVTLEHLDDSGTGSIYRRDTVTTPRFGGVSNLSAAEADNDRRVWLLNANVDLELGDWRLRSWDPLESTCRHASLSIL